MTIVTLTNPEQLFAAQAGALRRISAMRNFRNHRGGTPPMPLWDCDIESAGAEAAVAKYLGFYWESVSSKPEELDGDVSGIEVRSTKHKDGHLIVRTTDPDDSPFVLARGKFPTYEIVGWMYGYNAKQEKYWVENKRPSYWIPAKDLDDIAKLKAVKAGGSKNESMAAPNNGT